MKFLRFIKKLITIIILIVFYIITISLTVYLLNYNKFGISQFGDTSLLVIGKGLTSDKYHKGDLVLVENKELKDYNEGDELFVYHLDGKGGADIVLGSIGQIHSEEKAITLQNGETYSSEFIMGTGVKTYNEYGKYLGFMSSKWGFFFLILIPNFFIFVFQLYNLIVEIKYGSDEETTK
jgi:hypothetical protein